MKYNSKSIGIITILFGITILFASCGIQNRIPVITEYDGDREINWYSTQSMKKVIAKDKDSYYYSIAFEDGTTYYATFGEWSLIEIGNLVEFRSKRMNNIVQVIKSANQNLK
jgi:hypothetical protein